LHARDFVGLSLQVFFSHAQFFMRGIQLEQSRRYDVVLELRLGHAAA
jgi:hypothetical protein